MLDLELSKTDPSFDEPHSKHPDRSSRAVILCQLVELLIHLITISPKDTIRQFV